MWSISQILNFFLILYFTKNAVLAAITHIPGYIDIKVIENSPFQRYNISHCNNVEIPKPHDLHGLISKLHHNGNCVNVYEQQDCSGQYIRLKIVSLFNTVYNLQARTSPFLKDEPISIGPCFDQCDPLNWSGMDKDTAVTIRGYSDEDWGGRSFSLEVSGPGCTKLPLWRLREHHIESIEISGSRYTTCIELHENGNCGGASVQLRPGYPYLRDLYFWALRDYTDVIRAKSVSFCGSFCRGDEIPSISSPDKGITPGSGMITVYDDGSPGYYGVPTHINMSGYRCYNFQKTTPRSFQTYGACIEIFGSPDCGDRSKSRVVEAYRHRVEGTKAEYYEPVPLTARESGASKALSFRLCKEVEVVEQTTTTTTDVTPRFNETPPTELTDIIEEAVDEIEDKEEKSESVWVWAILAIVLVSLFLAVVITRYVKKVKFRSNISTEGSHGL